jgi:hypothetical protein
LFVVFWLIRLLQKHPAALSGFPFAAAAFQQTGDGCAVGMVRTQDLSQKDPQCDQGRIDPL